MHVLQRNPAAGGNPSPELAQFIRWKYEERRFAATNVEAPTSDNYTTHPFAASPSEEPSASATPGTSGSNSRSGSAADLLGMASPAARPAAAAAPADPFAALAGAGPAPAAPVARHGHSNSILDEWTDFESAVPTASSSGEAAGSGAVDPFAFLLNDPKYATCPAASAEAPAVAANVAVVPPTSSSDDILKLFDAAPAPSAGGGFAPAPALARAANGQADDGFGSFV